MEPRRFHCPLTSAQIGRAEKSAGVKTLLVSFMSTRKMNCHPSLPQDLQDKHIFQTKNWDTQSDRCRIFDSRQS